MEVMNIRQENLRRQVHHELLIETLCSMKGTVYDCVQDLVFHLGEIKPSEWAEDRKRKHIMVFLSFNGQFSLRNQS
jgi:hypothetical protein